MTKEQIGNKIDLLYKQQAELNAERLQHFEVRSDFVNPMIYNIRGTREAILKDGCVYVGSQEFEFVDNDSIIESCIKKDDELVFWLTGYYMYIAIKKDYEEYENAKKLLSKVTQELGILKKNMRDIISEEARKEFWSNYDIPFEFVVNVKPVKSGYTESSSGNGSNSATVYHIVLNEDVEIGRLKRRADEYLCTQPTWDAYSEISAWEDKNTLPLITCKQCLKRIEKFKKDDVDDKNN